MEGPFWVKVYGPGWDQCVKVDRVDWSPDSLQGFVGDTPVLFVHLASIDGVFIVTQSKGKDKDKKP